MSTGWRARPGQAQALAAALVAVPVVLAVLAGALASRVPAPYGVRVLAAVGTAGLALLVLERAGRRLLPLVTLLRLSLVFPDRTPSRFRIALSSGSTRELRERARRSGDNAPQEAAELVVQLLASLGKHDAGTRRHTENVRAYTDVLAEGLHLPEADRVRLRWAALVHDLGKLTLDPALLSKPAALDEDEWSRVRRHPTAGAALAAGLEPFLGPWFDTVEQHHERWDGSGYPNGLVGDEICLGARIVAVADSFEVMTAGRTYTRPMPPEEARIELVRCGGTQFDPDVVRLLLGVSLQSLTRKGAPWVMGAAAPFAGSPDLVGVHPATALHPAAETHLASAPNGTDAGGGQHHTGHEAAVGAPGGDQR